MLQWWWVSTGRLTDKFGLDVLIPEADERKVVHDIIYDELCKGAIKQSSKQKYLEIMQHLEARGAQGIILGCTEIGLLVGQADTKLPVFDTARIHAEAAVTRAIEQGL